MAQTPGDVLSALRIGENSSGFGGLLDDKDRFGYSATNLGDLDGNGVPDLVVGAGFDDDGGTNRGAIWILFLKADGTVASHSKISSTQGGFAGPLADKDSFARGLARFADLDGGDLPELVVGAPYDDGLGVDRGAAWVLAVDAVAPAEVLFYGSGINPANSLVLVNGQPSVGTGVTLGIDNPIATQAAGSLPILFLSYGPDPAFPAGSPIPGLGMGGPGQMGELLIDPSGNALFDAFVDAPWSGPGQPAAIPLTVPPDPSLFGQLVFAQGLLFDSGATLGVRFGLTAAAVLRIGP